MASQTKLKLFESDDEDSDADNCELTINEKYAEKYSAWKEKEELQKLKEKYGDVSDSSSSSGEEDYNWNDAFEKEFIHVYTKLVTKDKDIYDENIQFVRDEEEEEEDSDSDSSESKKETTSRKKKKKEDGPMTIRDYERKIMTERQGVLSDSEDEAEKQEQALHPGYHEEQEAIRKSILQAMAEVSSGDEDGDVLTRRVKSDKEKEKEEQDYLLFLKGEKEIEDMKSSYDKEFAKEVAPLRNFFSMGSSDWTEDQKKIVWDQLIVRGPMKETKNDLMKDEVGEEMELIQMEDDDDAFEHAYNFRFEEPDKDFIKNYKRKQEDSLRQEANKRAEKRKAVRERKKKAMEERREELQRLKKLKKKELESRLELLMKYNPGVSVTTDDLKGTFDPKGHDKLMEKFNKIEEENCDDEDSDKPDIADLEDICSLDSYTLETANENRQLLADVSEEEEVNEEEVSDTNEPQTEEEDSRVNVHAGYDSSWLPDMSRSSRKARKKKKKTLREAVFDALEEEIEKNDKDKKTLFGDYVRQYCSLDNMYNEGFKYHSVVPNDYNLSYDELLWAPAPELDAWVPLKKMMEPKSDLEEVHEQKKYKSAKMQRKKLNVMPSLKKMQDEENLWEDIRPCVVRQKMAEQAEEKDGSDSEQLPTEEDLGSRLQTEVQSSPKKRKASSSQSDETQRMGKNKKKRKLATDAGVASENGDLLHKKNETEHQTQPPAEAKKKKKRKLAPDASENGDPLHKKNVTEHQAQPAAEVKKKKKKRETLSENLEVEVKKKKKKEKIKTASSESVAEQGTTEKLKKKKQKSEAVEQAQSTQVKDKKNRKKGKKKQKGTPKVRGYIAKDKIKESRLAAFHIDPRKFKYTKDRIAPIQMDQE